MPIFASFSKRAQLAMKLARDAAAGLHHPFVGTLHLLLGLLQAGGQYPALLTDRVTAENVRAFNSFEAPDVICDRPFAVSSLDSLQIPPHSVVRICLNKK